MARILFDHDEITGTRTWYESDGAGGFRLVTEADCEPVLDGNKQLQSGSGRDYWKGDVRKEASIPNVILMKWLVEDGIQYWTPEGQSRIVKKLNDPEWRYLKCADVMVG